MRWVVVVGGGCCSWGATTTSWQGSWQFVVRVGLQFVTISKKAVTLFFRGGGLYKHSRFSLSDSLLTSQE